MDKRINNGQLNRWQLLGGLFEISKKMENKKNVVSQKEIADLFQAMGISWNQKKRIMCVNAGILVPVGASKQRTMYKIRLEDPHFDEAATEAPRDVIPIISRMTNRHSPIQPIGSVSSSVDWKEQYYKIKELMDMFSKDRDQLVKDLVAAKEAAKNCIPSGELQFLKRQLKECYDEIGILKEQIVDLEGENKNLKEQAVAYKEQAEKFAAIQDLLKLPKGAGDYLSNALTNPLSFCMVL